MGFTGRLDTLLTEEINACYQEGRVLPYNGIYGYVLNYAPLVVLSLSQAKEEDSHFNNCCLEQCRKFSLLGKSLESQRLSTLPPQSTTR